jgi:isoleucyl-tRNA synthetase
MLTPILAFTSEEIWSQLKKKDDPISVQLLEWPEAKDKYANQEVENKIDQVLVVREVVTKALEEARVKKVIGHSLGAWISIYADQDWIQRLQQVEALEKLFIVSRVDIKPSTERSQDALALEEVKGIWVKVQAAQGEKCERCWIIEPSVGMDTEHPTLCGRCSQVLSQLNG